MKNTQTYKAQLTSLTRLRNSVNGNPRYLATFVTDDNTTIQAATTVDSSLAYRLPNYLNKHVRVDIGTHYGKVAISYLEEEV